MSEENYDIDRTVAMSQHLLKPLELRDEAWKEVFLANLIDAPFACGKPEVVAGPDGFPYFQLVSPLPEVKFEAFSIEYMTPRFLLEHGLGVVINPKNKAPDWVLNYGNIVNFYLHGEFYSDASSSKLMFDKEGGDSVLSAGSVFYMGDPAANVLPLKSRAVLRDFLKKHGVLTPKVVLQVKKEDEGFVYDLWFNIPRNIFANEDEYRQCLSMLAWFLPSHYASAAVSEEQYPDMCLL
jgi:hypothetical protein